MPIKNRKIDLPLLLSLRSFLPEQFTSFFLTLDFLYFIFFSSLSVSFPLINTLSISLYFYFPLFVFFLTVDYFCYVLCIKIYSDFESNTNAEMLISVRFYFGTDIRW